jgi:Na+-transporting methylmalonyl-CoA/oxaloacetate decarboxylase gamma subunit
VARAVSVLGMAFGLGMLIASICYHGYIGAIYRKYELSGAVSYFEPIFMLVSVGVIFASLIVLVVATLRMYRAAERSEQKPDRTSGDQ